MRIEVVSRLPANTDRVWRRITTTDGINHELAPWLTMTPPAGQGLSIEKARVGEPLGRWVIRLFGVLPVEYDLLMLRRVDPGIGFHEDSTMLTMRRWQHLRTVYPEPDGRARLVDVVIAEPRRALIPARPLLRLLLTALFRHRHRRIADFLGNEPSAVAG